MIFGIKSSLNITCGGEENDKMVWKAAITGKTGKPKKERSTWNLNTRRIGECNRVSVQLAIDYVR